MVFLFDFIRFYHQTTDYDDYYSKSKKVCDTTILGTIVNKRSGGADGDLLMMKLLDKSTQQMFFIDTNNNEDDDFNKCELEVAVEAEAVLFDVMDYLHMPVFNNDCERCLVSSYGDLVENIEKLNLSTYDYLTAAEEEYEFNGKISNSNTYSTVFAYLDASYCYLLCNFDKRTLFYENQFESFYAFNELNAEIYDVFRNDSFFCDQNEQQQQYGEKSKWDDDTFKRPVEDEVFTHAASTMLDAEYTKKDDLQSPTTGQVLRPSSTRNWTVAPKLINNTNIITSASSSSKKLVNSCQTTSNTSNFDPIGTKPRSMSSIPKRSNRLNSVNNKTASTHDAQAFDCPAVFTSDAWTSSESLQLFEGFNLSASAPKKYKVSKLIGSILNDAEKQQQLLYAPPSLNSNNNNRSEYHQFQQQQQQQQQNRIRSCYDYRQHNNNNNRQKYKIDNTTRSNHHHYHSVSESSSSSSTGQLSTSSSTNSIFKDTNNNRYKYKRK